MTGEAPLRLGAGTLLGRVSAELSGMQDRALDLQSAIGADAGSAEALQDIDRMTPEVGDLSTLLARLAALAPGDWEVDADAALGALTLVSLSARLASGDTGVDTSDGGDIDLFDAPEDALFA